jgi:hypothetical protein
VVLSIAEMRAGISTSGSVDNGKQNAIAASVASLNRRFDVIPSEKLRIRLEK